ncbi:beta-glucosidase [Dysgonomonas macrotermitis]|nr:glycoside hydrolase family 3 C-terminal domain-containing protein [Dysgonomonas macrotermitis]
MKFLNKLKITSILALSATINVSAQAPAKITVDNMSFADLNKNGKLEPYEDTRLPNNQRVSDLMKRLTIDDKLNLVLGIGMIGFDMLKGFDAINPIVEAKDFMVPGAAGSTMPLLKYGLPAVIMTDGPAGVRINPNRQNTSDTFFATGFPAGSSIASTWDVALVEAVGNALGNETREYGSDIQLGPALNIMRNPLCGRNYEYYSEDPVVSGKIAAAMTLGIQSNDVGVSLKHYAANNSERNRMGINVHVSPRTLREIYLRGFEIAVKESDPKTIMSSYNMINGKYTSADYDLLTTILRDEWGFKGLVMTDWFGGYSDVSNLFNSTLSGEDFAKNYTSEQIKAGNDLLMPGIRPQLQNLKDDLKSGKITEQEIDICVRRVLDMVFDSHKMKDYKYSDKPDLKAHAELTRKAASEGMVLLENKNKALPFTTDINKLAVFGSLSYKFISGGTGSGHVNKAYTVSLIEGLTKAGYTLDKKVNDVYVPFVAKEEAKQKAIDNGLTLLPLFPQPVLKESLIAESAKNNDLAVITIGRSSGELDDRPLDGDFYLTKEELALLDQVSAAFHVQGKKVVVVINVGAVIEMSSWKDKVDAILLAWLPGQEAGNSVADVLSGKVNPSGKLAMTIPAKYEDLSTADNFQGLPIEKPTDVTYSEGIYIGYRYFDTKKIEPAYPFGYGLSYTTFEYSNIKVSDKEFGNEIFVTVDIKNTGSIAGKEVVQLYMSAPKTGIDKPEKELKAFAKTRPLNPGESQTLFFKLNPKDLASFNENVSAWVADKGTYSILIGSSSRNISQKASFDLSAKRIVEKVNNVMSPDIKFIDLRP